MLTRLLSNDFPRSRVLAVVLLLVLVALATTPFIFPGVKALNVAAKVLVFIVLVASFDLCWALPVSSVLLTPCSLASAPMASR